MQLVRADQAFRLLRDHAVHGRQKLGADRGVQDVFQHFAERAAGLLGGIVDQVAHQGFGHGGVDRIHGHVIAVVGRPAERQLGEVPGPDDQAAVLIGQVHQDLGALARLGVFIRHVVYHGIVADVLEMAAHRVADRHGAKIDPQKLGQLFRVALGAAGGAESGHGHSQNALAGQGKRVECAHGHQQRQGGIQPPGEPHHGMLDAGVG